MWEVFSHMQKTDVYKNRGGAIESMRLVRESCWIRMLGAYQQSFFHIVVFQKTFIQHCLRATMRCNYF